MKLAFLNEVASSPDVSRLSGNFWGCCMAALRSAIIACGVWASGRLDGSDKQNELLEPPTTPFDTVTPKHFQSSDLLYRGMRMSSLGLPEIGPSARKLGIRNIDVISQEGLVFPGNGGMSVSPDTPLNLPSHRRPNHFGGTGNDPVWAISRNILENYGLVYRQDKLTHGLIEPLYPMSIEEFQQKLADTQTEWQLVTSIEDKS